MADRRNSFKTALELLWNRPGAALTMEIRAVRVERFSNED